jgi:site-specific recombinase XerD
MSRGPRERIATGVYRDRYGISVKVKNRGEPREERFPRDTPIEELERHQARMESELLEDQAERAQTGTAEPTRGTFAGDLPRYLKQIAGRSSFKSDRSHLRAWLPHVGTTRRSEIKPSHIREAFAAWQSKGLSARTIRHRRRVLRELYQTLDGVHARPPLKGVKAPRPPDPHPIAVPIAMIQKVAKSLRSGLVGKKRHGPKKTLALIHYKESPQTYARFLVRATTGQRPAQIMWATPADVDLKRRIWFVRAAKGGYSAALPLNGEMVRAWRVFIKAKAWGSFDARSFAKTLRRHGWPAGIRPYALRSTFAIDHLLKGTSLGDLQGLLGHRQIETTRRHYASVQVALLKKQVGKRLLKLA